MAASQEHRWFVVRNEGGVYEFLPFAEWRATRKLVPIYGIRLGRTLWIYDKILATGGNKPLRIRKKWQPLPQDEYEKQLREDAAYSRYAPKWPEGYAFLKARNR